MAFAVGFWCDSEKFVYISSAAVLFLTVVGYFIYVGSIWGIETAFFESKADVSYFILCVPFALYALSEKDRPKIKNPI